LHIISDSLTPDGEILAVLEGLGREVQSEPGDFSKILEFFGSEVAGEDASAYRKQMKEMLSRLEHLGLIKNA